MKINKKYLTSLVLGATTLIMGCKAGGDFPGREYMPDMGHSRAYETYTEGNAYVVDGEGDKVELFGKNMTALKPVEGTIPRGFVPYHLDDSNDGYTRSGSEIHNPYANNGFDDAAKSGKEAYNIYCAVCHGEKGKANGSIVEAGKYPAPPSYFDAAILELDEGKMFHSVHYGKNLMGSYASQLTKDERWRVISYIKGMQADHIAAEKKIDRSQALGLINGTNTYKNDADYSGGVNIAADNDDAATFVNEELEKLASAPLTSGQSIVLKNVFFETGSFNLKANSFYELNKLVQILNSNPEAKVEISGHTDSQGAAASNLKLSSNRAKSVFSYLVSKGISGERLVSKGYGSVQPVASNDTDEGRAQNRRTEFKVL